MGRCRYRSRLHVGSLCFGCRLLYGVNCSYTSGTRGYGQRCAFRLAGVLRSGLFGFVLQKQRFWWRQGGWFLEVRFAGCRIGFGWWDFWVLVDIFCSFFVTRFVFRFCDGWRFVFFSLVFVHSVHGKNTSCVPGWVGFADQDEEMDVGGTVRRFSRVLGWGF